jgi:2-dehydro-3-deoxygalactonokinase
MKDGQVLGEGRSEDGMGRLEPDGFEPALLALVDPWLGEETTEILVCGMAGARRGWREAAYRTVPCTPLGPPPEPLPGTDPRIAVRILPGLSQARPHPDVMRGEETQIAGALDLLGEWDGVLCLPGTHCKWAEVSAGEVTSFTTFLTGELFALLSERSTLRDALAGEGWDEPAFLAAASDALSRPEAAFARLFRLRAAALLGAEAPEPRGTLSGLLVGAELAAARPWWLGRALAVVGGARPRRAYAAALEAQGAAPREIDGEEAVRRGLATARALREA